MPQEFAIIDVETTGSNYGRERITEIAILIHNGKRVIETYNSLVNPERSIDPFVVAMTRISDEMVEEAPHFAEVADEIWSLTENRIFVAHNVRFDYGMVRKEFGLLGKKFIRKQLCTIRLAKKIFPDKPSYGLGKLCAELEIKLVNRHRAFGDAAATSVLFERLLFNDRKEMLQTELNHGLTDNILPANLTRAAIDALPEEVGVYYFLDKDHKILYIGKSTNIKKRVISHFSSDLKSDRFSSLKHDVYHIDYTLTGNELVALLLESDEIKRYMPPFNRAQRRRKFRYGVYERQDDRGFSLLRVETLKLDEEPVMKYATRRGAERALERFELQHSLHLLNEIKPQLNPKNGLEEHRNNHNKKYKEAINTTKFSNANFFLINESGEPDEVSIVWVEDYVFKGYGTMAESLLEGGLDVLKSTIQQKYDNPEVRKIIKDYIKKHKYRQLIPYE